MTKYEEKPDLYRRKDKFAKYKQKIKDAEIPEKNKKLLLEFVESMRANKLSYGRMNKYMLYLRRYAEMLKKEFKEADITDVKRIIADFNDLDYSIHTKHDFGILVKRFYKWLEGEDETYPKKVRWIRTTMTPKEKHTLYPKPHEIPTNDDIKKMIEKARTTRDRCLVALLFDSGCRVGELLGLQVKDVELNGNRSHITVEGKTGMRRVFIKHSIRYIQQWLENHPHKEDKNFDDAWFFVNYKGQQLGYRTVHVVLKDLKGKCGLKKHVKVNPHAYRHAQATELYRLGVSEAVIKKQLGWSKSSRMPEVYEHMVQEDVDNAIDQAKRDVDDPPPKPKPPHPLRAQFCDFCGTKNTPTAKYCERCGSPMNKRTLIEQDEARGKLLSLLELPEVKKAIFEAMEKEKQD